MCVCVSVCECVCVCAVVMRILIGKKVKTHSNYFSCVVVVALLCCLGFAPETVCALISNYPSFLDVVQWVKASVCVSVCVWLRACVCVCVCVCLCVSACL